MEKILIDKLKNLSDTVMKDVASASETVEHDTIEKVEKALSERENVFLENAYDTIQEKISVIVKEDSEKVRRFDVKSKRTVLEKREQIIDEVFESVRKKLQTFREKDNYEAWLIDKCRASAAELGDGNIEFKLASLDMVYSDKLCALSDAFTCVECSEITGGVIATNLDKRISVNYSFEQRLIEEREAFLNRAGLSIG